jgi:hypothetical protein
MLQKITIRNRKPVNVKKAVSRRYFGVRSLNARAADSIQSDNSGYWISEIALTPGRKTTRIGSRVGIERDAVHRF